MPKFKNVIYQPDIKTPLWKHLQEFVETLRIFAGCVMDSKVHCLSRKASYALFIHVFNRLTISLEFPNSEAVSTGEFIIIRREIHI